MNFLGKTERVALDPRPGVEAEASPSAPERDQEGELSSLEAERLALEAKGREAAAKGKDADFLVAGAEAAQAEDPLLLEIDRVLQANLATVLTELADPQHKDDFIATGRALAQDLFLHPKNRHERNMVDSIRRWLQRLPGIQKDFIEQVAKTKTDELLNMFKKQETP